MASIQEIDQKYMRRSFHLARMPVRNVSPNPRVGALLVFEDRIIGEGYHQAYGSPHAEVNAVRSVSPDDRNLIQRATLYVSLEPCFHYGKTPPCVDLVIREKIPRVVISTTDPNPKVNGKSLERLRRHGIEVVTGILPVDGFDLIKPFLFAQTKLRPYILLKYACSRDGFLGKPGEKVWLSTPATRRVVHKWRSKANAILCGGQTVRIDDPSLTTRYYYGTSPTRIVLSRSGKLPPNAKILDGSATTIICSPNKPSPGILGIPENHWFRFDGSSKNFRHLFEYLVKKGVHSLIVEGGAEILNYFIKYGLWDEARLIETATSLKKGIPVPEINGQQIARYSILSDNITVLVNPDNIAGNSLLYEKLNLF